MTAYSFGVELTFSGQVLSMSYSPLTLAALFSYWAHNIILLGEPPRSCEPLPRNVGPPTTKVAGMLVSCLDRTYCLGNPKNATYNDHPPFRARVSSCPTRRSTS